MKTKRIVIAEDITLLREGLCMMIDAEETLKQETSWDMLTKRELEVLKLVGEGHTSKEVAGFLCISPKTVERHRANIMNKLDLHNVSELTAYAIEKGLIGREPISL